MTKVEIIALAEHWQAKADRAMDRYQESGLPRHNREREQADDLVNALRIAANAADDHDELISLRGAVCCLAVKAHAAVDALDAPDRAADRDILTDLARNIISTARLYGVDSALPTSRKRANEERAAEREGGDG